VSRDSGSQRKAGGGGGHRIDRGTRGRVFIIIPQAQSFFLLCVLSSLLKLPEQQMIDSLAQHGVLSADLAPSLVTTQTVNNPDFDPEAKKEREEEEEAERQRAEERRKEDEELERIERERIEARKRAEAEEQVLKGEDDSERDLATPPPPAYSSTPQSEAVSSSSDSKEDLEAEDLDQEDGELDDEDDGDIGAAPRAGQSSNRTSKRQSQLSKASEVIQKASPEYDDDYDGDIGGLARASTPKPNGSISLPPASDSPSQPNGKSLGVAEPTIPFCFRAFFPRRMRRFNESRGGGI